MASQNQAEWQHSGSSRSLIQARDMAHAEATLAGHGETGRLILDRLGRILSCGSPAERIFGADPGPPHRQTDFGIHCRVWS